MDILMRRRTIWQAKFYQHCGNLLSKGAAFAVAVAFAAAAAGGGSGAAARYGGEKAQNIAASLHKGGNQCRTKK